MSVTQVSQTTGYDSALYNNLIEQAKTCKVSTAKVDETLLQAINEGKDFKAAVEHVGAMLPELASPPGSTDNLKAWVGMPSPCALYAALMVDEAAEQRTANRSIIKGQGDAIAANMEDQAKKIKQGAIDKFACALTSAIITTAAGTASFIVNVKGMGYGADDKLHFAGDGVGANGMLTSSISQSITTTASGVGSGISAGGDFSQSMYSAEGKKLEAKAEKIRTSMELTKQTNEAMRDLIAKALEFMNSMQANMNQTRTRILG